MTKSIAYSLAGYVALSYRFPTFGLPIFKKGADLFAQRVNHSGTKVLGFLKVDGKNIRPISNSRLIVGVGDPPLYLFVTEDGKTISASKERLYGELKIQKNLNAYPNTVLAQLDRLFPSSRNGDDIAKLAFDIKGSQGEQAYLSYLSSAMRSKAWEYIEYNFPKVMEKIILADDLSSIDFYLTKDHQIQFINHSSKVDIPNKDTLEVISHLNEFLVSIERYGEKSNGELLEDQLPNEADFACLPELLGMVGRQEERIAILSVVAILFPREVSLAIEGYSSRARSEKSFCSYLRTRFKGSLEPDENINLILSGVRKNWHSGSRILFAKYFLFWFFPYFKILEISGNNIGFWQVSRYAETFKKLMDANGIVTVDISDFLEWVEYGQLEKVFQILEVSRKVSEIDVYAFGYGYEYEPNKPESYILDSFALNRGSF